MPNDLGLSPADVAHVHSHGLTTEAVHALVDKLRAPPRFVPIEKAATRGGGVVELADVEDLADRFGGLATVPGKFTPMSGAASRMFGFLERVATGTATPDDVDKTRRVAHALDDRKGGPRLALAAPLRVHLAGRGTELHALLDGGDLAALAHHLLDDDGLGLRGKPKAVIPFHLRDGRPVTPLEEHMREALAYAGGRLHATISPEHRPLYDLALDEIRTADPSLRAVQVEFSVQHWATDSVAVDAETGALVRDEEGVPAFFPAGHGSLLRNIGDLGRPAVLRNVDNVPTRRSARRLVEVWHRGLAVLLSEIRGVMSEAMRVLDEGGGSADLLERCLTHLRRRGVNLLLDVALYERATPQEKRAQLREALLRPIKVVGVVKNEGEPGGGPFVIPFAGHRIVSIVEKDEIAADRRQMMRDGEFFNPVDILIDPTDHRGRPFDLTLFVNADRHFLVRKPYRGRDVVRLEHPGLWNGAMEGWTSLFVAMPLATFAPVKELVDLLRPEHQEDVSAS